MALGAGRPSRSIKEKSIADVKIDEPEKTQRFNVDIPVSLHRKIKIQAVQEGVKLNELAIRLFEDYLSKISKV
jgi:predicted HicB family RNase H-like nuclease